jgi:hypothetical protein
MRPASRALLRTVLLRFQSGFETRASTPLFQSVYALVHYTLNPQFVMITPVPVHWALKIQSPAHANVTAVQNFDKKTGKGRKLKLGVYSS